MDTSSSQPCGAYLRQSTKIRFVNTTWHDIEMHHHLSLQTLGDIQPPRRLPLGPKLPRQPQPGVQHMDLVYYFFDVAYHSLATFNSATSRMRDSLMRMALAHDTASGRALFYALLAVSSLRRSGLHLEAIQFKVAALHALSASTKAGALSSAEAAQHVATCMLLGTFEILLSSERSGEWLWYIRGAMDIIQGAGLEQKSDQSDIGNLLDWVYYHNALSCFAMHHWRHKLVVPGAADADTLDSGTVQYLPLSRDKPVIRSSNPAHAILNLLSETCDTLLDPMSPKSQDGEYKGRIKSLEQRISNLPYTQTPEERDTDLKIPVEIYQIATLVYLARASQSPWDPPAILDHLIERAFAVPRCAMLSACDHFFPLFILACEARTDEQRATILELIDRTEEGARVRSLQGLKAEIESVWAQQDLYADSKLLFNYFGVLNAVVSSNKTLPSYV